MKNKIIAAAAIGLLGMTALAAVANVPGNPASVTRSGEETHTTSIGGLTLPKFIGPLEFIGEQSGADPHSMATYSYRAMGLALDIHVSDLGVDGIADGIGSPELARRYDQTKKNLVAATAVRGLKAHETTVALADGDARRVREALYQFKRRGEGGTTYLWFTAAHGLVIDARFDAALGYEEDGAIGRSEILEAIGAAIPASAEVVAQARARAAAPAAGTSADPSMKVAILWDPETPEGESKIWLAYLFARAAFAANETNGGPAAGERVSSFDEEVRGRTIALTTFRALKHEPAQPVSEYFNDIDRVEAAGFLREYVWSYLHNVSWGTTPSNLDLAGFEVWRAEHLANHKAVTHGRIAFRLALAQ
ncbi:MAG: hypothetical protein WDO56_13210 [Gammaproteobacteria bacterium]